MSDLDLSTTICPRCKGIVYHCELPGPFGSPLKIVGTCHRCDRDRDADAARAQAKVLAAERLLICGTDEPDVWPILRPVLADALKMPSGAPGVIWVRGAVMSGRSTLARAWVRESIRQGHAARYVTMDELWDVQPSEGHALQRELAAVDRLALDGVGQSLHPLATWQRARLAAILSGRPKAWTLATVCAPSSGDGAGLLDQAVGDEVATRLRLLRRLELHLRRVDHV